MSNTLTYVVPQLLAQGLLALRQRVALPRIVNRKYDPIPGGKGSTVDIPIPSAITAVEVTSAATPPSTAAIAPTRVQVACNYWWEAPFTLDDKEELDVLDGIIPMQASEAIKSIANKIESTGLLLYKNVYGYAGTAATTPFSTDLTAYTTARKILTKQLADVDPRFCLIDPDAEEKAINLRAFQDASFSGSPDVIVNGQIGRKLGALWICSQLIPTHTLGATAQSTFALDAGTARAIGTKSLHMDGFSVKPNVGDIFTIAGDTQTYTVTATSDLSTYDVDITFEPGLAVAIPAADGNEVVTFKATHVVNLLMHRDAFAFVTRPLASSGLGLGHFETAIDPESGLVLRLEISREYKRTRFSYDALWGWGCPRPELACRIAG
jgi:hypothetical protein